MLKVVKTTKGFYRFAWIFCKLIFKIFFGLRVEGEEHVPATNRVILASNHISLLDPPVIGTATTRELNYLAKAELFEQPILRQIITGLNAIPIRRESMDKTTLKKVVKLLCQGEALLLFPEGTRAKGEELNPGRAGVGMLALKTKTPIVPVYISGCRRLFRTLLRKDRIQVRFGKPLMPEDFNLTADRHSDYQRLVKEVMTNIQSLSQKDLNPDNHSYR